MLQEYVHRGTEKLRCGYTTGSCATAAAKAAAYMLLTQEKLVQIDIMTPKGIPLLLDLADVWLDGQTAGCAVKKDSGDDPDITNGMLVYATVRRQPDGITIEGGEGIGRVTRDGLDQPKGAAAINSTPRRMIEQALEEVADAGQYDGGFFVEISAPEGVGLAKKTLNAALGIVGGISIIGTSGIVEPMSTKALLDTIALEIRQRKAEGETRLTLTLGNYGNTFVATTFPLQQEKTVTCSNYIGDAIELALAEGFREIEIIGHIGKLVKLGAGIMNTHSAQADGRMEVLAACAIRAGVQPVYLEKVLDCVAVDEALAILQEQGKLDAVMEVLLQRIQHYLDAKVKQTIPIHAILFSNRFGMLGRSGCVQTEER